jgi:hypothetical protein
MHAHAAHLIAAAVPHCGIAVFGLSLVLGLLMGTTNGPLT